MKSQWGALQESPKCAYTHTHSHTSMDSHVASTMDESTHSEKKRGNRRINFGKGSLLVNICSFSSSSSQSLQKSLAAKVKFRDGIFLHETSNSYSMFATPRKDDNYRYCTMSEKNQHEASLSFSCTQRHDSFAN